MARVASIERESATGASRELLDRVDIWMSALKADPRLNIPDRFQIPGNWKILAQSPRFAGMVFDLANYFLTESSVDQRLRELMVLLMLKRLDCKYFVYHLSMCEAVGVSLNQAHGITEYAGSARDLFTDRDRLALEYADNLFESGQVTDELFKRTQEALGAEGHFEFTCAIAFWSMYLLLINAFSADVDSWLGEEGVAPERRWERRQLLQRSAGGEEGRKHGIGE